MVSCTLPMPVASSDAVFTAIAHPVRRSLLDVLAVGAQPVNRLARRYRVSRPAISQHLRILLDAGLVEGRRDGRINNYALRADNLIAVHDWLHKYEAFWQQNLVRLGSYLDQNVSSQYQRPPARRRARRKP